MKRFGLSPQRAEFLCSLLLHVGGLIFFSLYYPHHFLEQEQEYIFQFSLDFFRQYLIQPGGIAGLTGDFLLQFCHIGFLGGVVITLLSLSIWLTTRALFRQFSLTGRWWVVALLPILLLWTIHCDYLSRISGSVAYLLTLAGLHIFIGIRNPILRRRSAPLLILLLYWICGGPFMGAAVAMAFIELFLPLRMVNMQPQPQPLRIITALFYLLVTLLIPILMRRFFLTISWKAAFFGEYIYENALAFPTEIFLLWAFVPAIILWFSWFPPKASVHQGVALIQFALALGGGYLAIQSNSNLYREHIFALSHYTQQREWTQALSYYERHKTEGKMSSCLVNLALANQGNLLNAMFFYPQYGEWGLVPEWTEDFWTPPMLHKVVAQIALANGSIGMHRANGFMSNVYGLRGMQPEVLQDQIRAEILNGSYEVASKMLRPLERSLFYRKWAREIRELLNHPESISQASWFRQMEQIRYTETPFDDVQEFAERRVFELDSTPRNRVAFEYFMADILLTRKIVPLIEHLPLLKRFGYNTIPIHLQEALLAYSTLPIAKQEVLNQYPISKTVGANYQNYMRMYAQYKDKPEFTSVMAKSFGNTYWYYMHFIVPALELYIQNAPFPQR